MLCLNKIYLEFLLLLFFLQTAESRAGGGEESSSDYSSSSSDSNSYDSSDSNSYDSSDSSDTQRELTTVDFYILVGIISGFVILGLISNSNSNAKFDKKHKEISEKLKTAKNFIWDENEIISSVKQSFIDLQKAWSKQDFDFIEGKLTKNLFIKWKDLLIEMRNRNERNVVSDIVINKIKFVNLDENEKKFTVLIDANVKDVTINIQSGKTVKDQTGGFKEFWTYIWGIDGWLLMEINQESESKKFL